MVLPVIPRMLGCIYQNWGSPSILNIGGWTPVDSHRYLFIARRLNQTLYLTFNHCPNQRRASLKTGKITSTGRFPDVPTYHFAMERTVHKARTFQEAAAWDIQQQVRMTPRERWLAARQLRERVFGRNRKDVRACHATN